MIWLEANCAMGSYYYRNNYVAQSVESRSLMRLLATTLQQYVHTNCLGRSGTGDSILVHLPNLYQ